MMHYENIDYVLGNFFTVANELTEDEGIEALRGHLIANPDFAAALRADVHRALSDGAYQWREALEVHDVVSIANEEQARQYAKKLLDIILVQ